MKNLLLLGLLLIGLNLSQAQIKTEIDGIEVELKKATEGELDLYWCVFQRKWYYFVETKNGTLVPLEEQPEDQYFYKAQLSKLTAGFGNTNDLIFELDPIQGYINSYNATLDPNYESYEIPTRIKWFATVFGGVTNNPFVTNEDNVLNPLIGLEFEFAGNVPDHKHSGFMQIRHAFKSDEFEYQATEFSVGYRYRFLRKEKFNLFGQVKVLTLNINEVVVTDEELMADVKINSTSFDAPFIFGIGADYKIGEKSYLTFMYSELFAIFFDNEGNFPMDFSLGYKFQF